MKRIISVLLTLTMFFTFIGGSTFAMQLVESNETNTEELSKIVLAVKSKINIPEALTEFEYNYNGETNHSSAGWRFTWRDKDYKERITINCDTDAHITYYDYYTSEKYITQAPQYLKEELQPKADEFINKWFVWTPEQEYASKILKSMKPKIYKKLDFKLANEISK